MISYHPDQKHIGHQELYSCNFRAVDTDDVTRIAKAVTNFVVSPIAFKDGTDRYGRFRKNYRHTSCFISSNWIGLDFDEGPTLAEMTRVFCDVTHVIGTTKSHQTKKGERPPCDRFRIFLKLPLTITNYQEYKDVLRYYVEEYDADDKCVDAARFFWPCKEITSILDSEDTIDLLKRKVSYQTIDYEDFKGTKSIPPWIRHWLKFGVPQGQKNVACLNMGIWLTRNGFSHSEIVSLIMNSPIPNRHDKVYDEVFKTTLNGVRLALEDSKGPKSPRDEKLKQNGSENLGEQ